MCQVLWQGGNVVGEASARWQLYSGQIGWRPDCLGQRGRVATVLLHHCCELDCRLPPAVRLSSCDVERQDSSG
jgi:hypothetical protein